MKTTQEQVLINKCLSIIEQKLGWGTSENWHSKVFDELSERILSETNVLLSSTTLKRVWNRVKYDGSPSISTLNTLSEFAGYANWRDFKNNTNSTKTTWFEKNIKPRLKIIIPSVVFLAVVIVSLFFISDSPQKPQTIDTTNIEFSCHTITNDIPNSVVFDFNLNGITSDSIYIQQFWDETKTIKIDSQQEQATGIYYYPGYFRAKLLVDGTIIKENDLFIKSNGWMATIDYEPIPKYIKQIDKLSLPNSALNEIKQSSKPLTSTYHFIDSFESVSGDNFRLKTQIKNVYNDKWAVCQNATIIIVGTKSALMIPFSIPGCASNIGVMMSEIHLSGKDHDLSALSLDLSQQTDLKIEVIDKQLTVFHEGKKLFTSNYKNSIGNIVGIRYKFLGAGEVSEIKLYNLAESKIIINREE